MRTTPLRTSRNLASVALLISCFGCDTAVSVDDEDAEFRDFDPVQHDVGGGVSSDQCGGHEVQWGAGCLDLDNPGATIDIDIEDYNFVNALRCEREDGTKLAGCVLLELTSETLEAEHAIYEVNHTACDRIVTHQSTTPDGLPSTAVYRNPSCFGGYTTPQRTLLQTTITRMPTGVASLATGMDTHSVIQHPEVWSDDGYVGRLVMGEGWEGPQQPRWTDLQLGGVGGVVLVDVPEPHLAYAEPTEGWHDGMSTDIDVNVTFEEYWGPTDFALVWTSHSTGYDKDGAVVSEQFAAADESATGLGGPGSGTTTASACADWAKKQTVVYAGETATEVGNELCGIVGPTVFSGNLGGGAVPFTIGESQTFDFGAICRAGNALSKRIVQRVLDNYTDACIADPSVLNPANAADAGLVSMDFDDPGDEIGQDCASLNGTFTEKVAVTNTATGESCDADMTGERSNCEENLDGGCTCDVSTTSLIPDGC